MWYWLINGTCVLAKLPLKIDLRENLIGREQRCFPDNIVDLDKNTTSF